jgi:hypothetical protein
VAELLLELHDEEGTYALVMYRQAHRLWNSEAENAGMLTVNIHIVPCYSLRCKEYLAVVLDKDLAFDELDIP